jgi:spore coat protein A, manganese oxidase
MTVSRRTVLKLGVVASTSLVGLTALGRLTRAQVTPQLQPFARSLIIPPVLKPTRRDATTDYYELTLQKASVEILPGTKTEVWGYNGITPGPTIQQPRDRPSVVRVINRLDQDSSGKPIQSVVHLHGAAAMPQYDGHTMDLIPPNHFKDYHYTNDHAATLWYHDHTMDYTARNINKGMAGFYIVAQTDDPSAASLPKGKYDIPLMLQAKQFLTTGATLSNVNRQKNIYGEVILVNGVPLPKLEVESRKYRFRILNASAQRHFQLALSRSQKSLTSDEKLVVIGTDAGFLSQPVSLVTPNQALPIGIAERYDVVIDFAQYPAGSSVYLHTVMQGVNFSGTVSSNARIKPFLRFDIAPAAEADPSRIPQNFQPIEPLGITAQTPQRQFTFSRNQDGKWTINNKVWEEERIDANPKPGAVEVWSFINPDKGRVHPVHLHLVDAQILDRNGAPPHTFERGWKDVFLLGEQETVRVAVRFRSGADFNGIFMMHCHQLIHEDNGMMSQFQVGKVGKNPVTAAPAQPM